MFGIGRKTDKEVTDRTVYMEFFGDNKVAYRVTAGKICIMGEKVCTYGIEAEDSLSGDMETIPDFSRNIEDAVDFAESLIRFKVKPKNIYSKALGYLCFSI